MDYVLYDNYVLKRAPSLPRWRTILLREGVKKTPNSFGLIRNIMTPPLDLKLLKKKRNLSNNPKVGDFNLHRTICSKQAQMNKFRKIVHQKTSESFFVLKFGDHFAHIKKLCSPLTKLKILSNIFFIHKSTTYVKQTYRFNKKQHSIFLNLYYRWIFY